MADKKEIPDDDKDAEGDVAPAPEAKKKISKKMLMIIAGVVFVILGGVAGAYFSGVFGKKAEGEEEVAGEEVAGEEAATKDEDHEPVYFNIPDMIVNLQGERNRPVFLKISMSLELSDPKDVPAVEKVLPRVVDNFQIYMRELRMDELRGSAGMYRLREELLMRVNQAVSPVKVRDVLFREMLVQ